MMQRLLPPGAPNKPLLTSLQVSQKPYIIRRSTEQRRPDGAQAVNALSRKLERCRQVLEELALFLVLDGIEADHDRIKPDPGQVSAGESRAGAVCFQDV